ncbi:MAG: metalloregulator ArsR/SmtB family transcription factor [Chloroflexota bacterium]|jgi:DNA-binding transcriptional ArsR family regulator|nr:metalloregulator ArsR/SmtB family transcription factor [Chloroflexota bacterium]MDH5243492.1 metalloregulator ArsR/SmtB family transcription factor [Chloroflexota bacterium]
MTTETVPTQKKASAPKRPRRTRGATRAPGTRAAVGAADEMTSATIDAQVMERAARVIRVLGHPLRLRILEVLQGGERHVTDLVDATGVSQALVSQHLAILRADQVVGARRDGTRVFYRITEPKVHRILACIRECDLPDLGVDATGPNPGLTFDD